MSIFLPLLPISDLQARQPLSYCQKNSGRRAVIILDEALSADHWPVVAARQGSRE